MTYQCDPPVWGNQDQVGTEEAHRGKMCPYQPHLSFSYLLCSFWALDLNGIAHLFQKVGPELFECRQRHGYPPRLLSLPILYPVYIEGFQILQSTG